MTPVVVLINLAAIFAMMFLKYHEAGMFKVIEWWQLYTFFALEMIRYFTLGENNDYTSRDD